MTVQSSRFIDLFMVLTATIAIGGCAKPPSDEAASQTPTTTPEPEPETPPRYLYVASGLCQSGQNTTFTATTASNVVYRVNLSTAERDSNSFIADYNEVPASFGDTPVSIVPFDANHLLVMVEKVGARRIEKVERKNNGVRTTFTADTAALANTLTALAPTVGGSYLAARLNGTAKISSTGVTQQASFSVSNVGGSCGTANAKYSSIKSTTFGHMLFVNSVASNNRLGIVRNSGTSCLAGTNAPQAGAYPTVLEYITGANQVIVAYSGNTSLNDINSLYVYDVTEDATTASLTNPTQIYDAFEYPGTYPFLLYGISAMTYDPVEGALYVATSITANATLSNYNYVIEKFTYNPTTKTLTRVGNQPFYNYGGDTKCISSMFVGD